MLPDYLHLTGQPAALLRQACQTPAQRLRPLKRAFRRYCILHRLCQLRASAVPPSRFNSRRSLSIHSLDPQAAAPLFLMTTAVGWTLLSKRQADLKCTARADFTGVAPLAAPPVHLIVSFPPLDAPHAPIRLQVATKSLHPPVQRFPAGITREWPLPTPAAAAGRAGIPGAAMPPRPSSEGSLPRGLVSGALSVTGRRRPLPGRPHLPRRIIVAVPGRTPTLLSPMLFRPLQIVHQACVLLSTVAQALLLMRQLWQGPAFSPASALVAASFLAQCSLSALLFNWPLVYWRNR